MNSKPKQSGDPKGRIVLPASGLAEDLLMPLVRSTHAQGATPQKPEGLYAFTDSLNASENKEDAAREAVDLQTWVTFTLDKESFGLPVTHVLEILRVTTITRVPHAPHPVRGVTNMRGKVLPVVDLRVRLGLPEKEIDGQGRILVVASKGRQLGLLVDSVQQVIRLAGSKIQPPPPDAMTAQSDYILGVYHLEDALVILLDVDRVLHIREALHQEGRSREVAGDVESQP